jgi:phosphatidylserine/phosphatidylglycerophosphate/cardiolipin synthase-like enzyme
LIVGLLIGSMLGYGVAPSDGDTTALENQISDLNSQVNTLQSQVQTKNETIAQLEEDIDRLTAQLEIEVRGVYFSPDGGCKSQVIYWASRANQSIHVLIYSFTLDDVSDALIDAYNSGVEVRVVFEKQQISQYSEYPKLKQAGVAVRNDTNSAYMHNKVMIIDETIVLTGSFNWSAHAEEQNSENLIVIKSTHIAETYEQEFQKIWTESI